jgi:hypothetical protein
VKFHAAGPDPLAPTWFVMEHIDGVDLASLVAHRRKRGRPLPLGAVLALADGLSQALVELAATPLGALVHRDLHPGNVMVGRDGRVMLVDFGVASLDAASRTAADPRGTVAWMAPEQLRGAPVTPTTDVWAAGLVLWEALTGVAPLPATPGLAALLAFRAAPLPPPSAHRAEVSPAIDTLVLQALAQDPAARPDAASWRASWGPLLATADATTLGKLAAQVADAGAEVRATVTAPGFAPVISSEAPETMRKPVQTETPAPSPAAAPEAPETIRKPAQTETPAPTPAAAPEAPTPDRLIPSGSKRFRLVLGATVAAAALGVAAWGLWPPANPPANPASPALSPAGDTSPAAPAVALASAAPSTAPTAAPVATTPAATPTPPPPASSSSAPPVPTVAASAPPATPTNATASPPGDTPPTRPSPRPAARAPASIRIEALDTPVHVAAGAVRGLAPLDAPAIPPDESLLFKLTGAAPAFTLHARLRHTADGVVLAAFGAPAGQVHTVACANGAPRPTPLAAVTVPRGGLSCRFEAADGRRFGARIVATPAR